MVCPHCQSDKLDRSRTRSWAERLIRSLTRLRPYRCRACQARIWRPETSRQRPVLRRARRRAVVSLVLALGTGLVAALTVIYVFLP